MIIEIKDAPGKIKSLSIAIDFSENTQDIKVISTETQKNDKNIINDNIITNDKIDFNSLNSSNLNTENTEKVEKPKIEQKERKPKIASSMNNLTF